MKYLVTESTAAMITGMMQPYMRFDRYSELKENNSYPIMSLYLDSENLKLYTETRTGKKNRFKLRIRSYTDDPEYPVFFEIKRRLERVIVKSRVMVMPSGIKGLLQNTTSTGPKDNIETKILNQFLFYKNIIGARPIIKIYYDRQAYEGIHDKRVRITFDRNLMYTTQNVSDISLQSNSWQKMSINRVVLEIKFTGQYPPWLTRMVQALNINAHSISKYATALEHSSILGYCAPASLLADAG